MPRYKLILEFDGGPFVGWQRQINGLSVQEALETAIQRYSGESVTTHAAGRTDAGVHALGLAVHADIERGDPADKVRNALNFHLRPHLIAVVEASQVPADFHARFSCFERSYIYRIVNRRAPLALDAGRAWLIGKPLDAAAMHEAAQVLVGHHDFSSFRATQCQSASPVKSLDELNVTRRGDTIEMFARARSFLHHQVRNMIGTLALVGEGKWDAADVRTALKARKRAAAGPTAPPDGLYFVAARYPDAAPPTSEPTE